MSELRTNTRKIVKSISNEIIILLLYVLKFLFIVNLSKEFDRSKIKNRTLVFLDEGKKRKIDVRNIRIFGLQTRFFIIFLKNKKIVFDRLPLGDSYRRVSHSQIEKKYFAKKIMFANNIPTPEGKVFKHTPLACDYAKKIGYPVVIKPVSGSLSKNVYTNLKNEKMLKSAIEKIDEHESKFLVEKFVPGDNYRVTIVNYKYVGCVMRYPAHVVGDGKNSIRKLIDKKNKHPLRKDYKIINATLYKIDIDKKLLTKINKSGYDINSVLENGKELILSDKINASSGVEIYDVTDKIHPKTRKMLEKVSRVFDAKLLGIDYVTKDIFKAYNKTTSNVIEVNPIPYIDLHHFPMKGRPQDVASAIWDIILRGK